MSRRLRNGGPAAVVRIRKYAGMEPGYQPLGGHS